MECQSLEDLLAVLRASILRNLSGATVDLTTHAPSGNDGESSGEKSN